MRPLAHTAIDTCLLRRQYVFVRGLVDCGCFTSNLVYPLMAQAIVEREHYMLAAILARGANPNAELVVNSNGEPLFGHFTIHSTQPDFAAARQLEAGTMSMLALAAKYKNSFAFRKLMQFNPNRLKATADFRRFNIRLTSTMEFYLLE